MPKLIMLKGLPASGKTSWAKEQIANAPKNSIKRVNKDDLRAMIDNGQWSKGNEKLILESRDRLIETYLFAGKNVIVDDTNIETKHEEQLRVIADDYGAQFEIKFFDVPVDECIHRDSLRENPVGAEVISKMSDRLKGKKTSGYKHNRLIDFNLPWAIIVDIDGTLAHNNGHRAWHDYTKVAGDEVHHHVKEVVNAMSESNTVLVVSGREDSCRANTEAWLNEHLIPHDMLFMRKTGDYRPDSVIKKEIFDTYIDGKFNILFVLDDRDRVVDMWRKELDIPCLQVQYGDF